MTALFTRFPRRWHRALAALGQCQLHGLVQRPVEVVALWAARRKSRAELAEMSERMLLDFGAAHADAWRESSKPFWRA